MFSSQRRFCLVSTVQTPETPMTGRFLTFLVCRCFCFLLLLSLSLSTLRSVGAVFSLSLCVCVFDRSSSLFFFCLFICLSICLPECMCIFVWLCVCVSCCVLQGDIRLFEGEYANDPVHTYSAFGFLNKDSGTLQLLATPFGCAPVVVSCCSLMLLLLLLLLPPFQVWVHWRSSRLLCDSFPLCACHRVKRDLSSTDFFGNHTQQLMESVPFQRASRQESRQGAWWRSFALSVPHEHVLL